MHSQNLRDATASSFNTPAPFHPATALHHNANKLPRLLASLPLALAPVLLTAQSSPPQQPAADDDAVVLAAVTVEGADVDKSVLPTRPNANFYGFEELIQNSPRSIFQVSKAQLEADNFDNFGDLARYSPSVGRGTVSSFSTFSKIRGGSGDTTRNGVLLIPAAVRPFNNNYWEAVDIVAGIPSVIQGSTTRTAGVVNYVTKKPTFDKDKTDITVSLGRLGKDNDTTYPQVTVQLDYNKVLGDDLAFRLSLQRTDADQYWGNARSNFYDLYAATTWKPLKNLTIETNYNYTNVYDSPKPTGINRLDQNLIDNWQYRSGYGTLQTTGYVVGSDVYTSAAAAAAVHGGSAADYKSSTLFGLRSPGNDGKWTVGSSPSSLTSAQFTDGWNFHGAFTLTGNLPVSDETVLVPINGSQTQWSDTAYTESQEHILQNIATLRINEHFTLKNNSLYQYSHSYVHDSDGYESYMINKMITSRFELTSDFEFGKSNAWLKKLGLRHQSNSGFELRYLYNYCDGINGTPLDLRSSTALDVTNPADGGGKLGYATLIGLTGSALYANAQRIGNDIVIASPYLTGADAYVKLPLAFNVGEGRYASPAAAGDRKVNDLWQNNFFTEQKLAIWKFILRGGARVTAITQKIRPQDATYQAIKGGYLSGWQGDLTSYKDKEYERNYDINGSISFLPFSWLTTYAAWDKDYASADCGCCLTQGYSTIYNAAGTAISYGLDPRNYHLKSTLREFGAKFEILPNQLFGSFAYFDQVRNNIIAVSFPSYPEGGIRAVRYRGTEYALTYQPSNAFATGVNYSHLSARTVGSVAQDSGTPKHTGNFWISYQLRNGLGAKASFWATSPWTGTFVVHSQHALNLGLFYDSPKWRVNIDFLNVTDEKNWSPSGGYGGDTLGYVLAQERFGVTAKVTRRF